MEEGKRIIPKIIHYCWFGSKPIPEKEKKCMLSWEKYFPDYEIKFWNENTFSLENHLFAKQAYESSQFAFVSDYVRAQVLYEYGGVYLDTDVEVLSELEPFFDNFEGVLGFETSKYIGTALLAFKPKHEIIDRLCTYYKNSTFLNKNEQIEITANPAILKKILLKYGVNFNGEEQIVNNLKVYPRSYFFPKKIGENNFKTTYSTVAIHHFEGSWLTDRQKKRGQNIIWIKGFRPVLRKVQYILEVSLGEKLTKNFERKIRNWLR